MDTIIFIIAWLIFIIFLKKTNNKKKKESREKRFIKKVHAIRNKQFKNSLPKDIFVEKENG